MGWMSHGVKGVLDQLARSTDGIRKDVRYALRTLGKSPDFAFVAMTTLALGIGLNTTIFSVVYGVVFRPLPYRDPQRIVQLTVSDQHVSSEEDLTYQEFQFLRENSSVFENLAAFTPVGFNLSMSGGTERINGLHVSQDYFKVLGVRPILGRTFIPREDEASGERVAILSYGLWKQHAGGDPNVLQRNITLDGISYTVIGVMPADFERLAVTPFMHGDTGVWVPLALVGTTIGSGQNLGVLGRLQSGISFEQGRVQMGIVGNAFRRTFPNELAPTAQLDIQRYQSMLSGDLRTILFVLFGAVGFVLLIACANVANLLLGRAAARSREIGIRSALGATRARLFRQLIIESVLLSLMGALAGWLLAQWGLRVLLSLSPTDLPRASDIRLDIWAFGFTLCVALLSSIGFGIVPALRLSRTDVNEVLKEGAGRVAGRRRRGQFTKALVIGQIGLSLLLVTGATLLIKTFWNVLTTDPGFDPRHVLSLQVWLAGSRYDSGERVSGFYDRGLDRIQALPGVESAAVVAAGLPLERGGNIGVKLVGKETPNTFGYRIITMNYFQTLGIPLRLGRSFDASDNQQSRPVVIISESFARQFFREGSPLGEHLTIGASDPPREIVGVAGNVRSYLDQAADPTVFIPLAQAPYDVMKLFEGWFATSVLIRTSNDPLALGGAAVQALHAVDDSVAVGHVRSMEQVRSSSVAMRRFNSVLLSLFAALAVVLAAVGIYGVIAYGISQRTHEIGVRMALGGRRVDILRLVLKEGMVLGAIGIVVGVGAALALTQLLESYLFGVRPTDPLTFLSVVVFLLLVSLMSIVIPAQRAMRVDPMVALRYE